MRLDLLPAPETADIDAGAEYRLLDGFDFPVMISGKLRFLMNAGVRYWW